MSGMQATKDSDRRRTEHSNANSGRGTSAPEKLQRFFERLGNGGFFGKVVVSYQNGKVCDVKIEQTKKLEEL
jgi:hypothetical protein